MPNIKYQISNIKYIGFTLIELLVVVAMIGILSTLVVANLNSARERGRDAARKSDIKSMETALRLYYNDFGVFPNSNASYEVLGCGQAGNSACLRGQAWIANSVTYMQKLPNDPLPNQSYRYTRNNLDSYKFQACLENKSDEAGKGTQDTNWCPSGWMFEVIQ